MSNTMFVIWIGLSAGILLLFLYAAFLNLRRRQSQGVELSDLMNSFLPVNVEVLSTLINPEQQRHLQESEELKESWNVDLEQDGRDRHRENHPGAEPRHLAFTLAQKHAPVGITHSRGKPPGPLA